MSAKTHKAYYLSRELSWLEFNARVLEEGLDKANPLLERLRFLAIVASNFDEFFMVRVAALKARLRAGDESPDIAGLSPRELLNAISRRAREISGRQYDCLSGEILPALVQHGLVVLRAGDYNAQERRWLEDYFANQVEPSLTPLAVPSMEEGGSFPSTGNLRIHAAFLLRQRNGEADRLAIIQVPANLGRFVRLPSEAGEKVKFALIDDLVLSFGHRLFPGSAVMDRTLFKVTRDADIGVDEDRDDDFVAAMEEVLVNRQNSWPVRMTISSDSGPLESLLAQALGLGPDDVYLLAGPIDLRSFMDLAELKEFDGLRFKAHSPLETLQPGEDASLWDEIKKNDLLLHVPYESFKLVLDFLESASRDPSVLAIKMTLYRTSGDSSVIRSLMRAARNGKQVTVIVELKARFDEERNIAWAARLEQAGAIVVYGVAKLKVHAKAIFVVRREEDGSVMRYVHLSTGNYNEKTAGLYSDLSVFSANPALAADLGLFFNMLTGLSSVTELKSLCVAPFDLKRRILMLIDRETERSSSESPGLIAAKMNSLCDKEIIDALYRASRAGVRVMLNVRGVCQLVPGVKGMSENIRVVSIIGRFLEHARIHYFRNGGAEELYLSSADWMERNLERRIELLFPVGGATARERVYDVLMSYFLDNSSARTLGPSGHWKRLKPAEGEEPFAVQDYFYAERSESAKRLNDRSGVLELKVRRKAP